MNTVLVVVGTVVLLFSLFIYWLAWGFLKSNKQIARELEIARVTLGNIGNPGCGLILGIIGIVSGVVLIIANI
tara:strand:- start:219 stop:437 length:219 start_codon:yes stop_codon:yes gene_type:complete